MTRKVIVSRHPATVAYLRDALGWPECRCRSCGLADPHGLCDAPGRVGHDIEDIPAFSSISSISETEEIEGAIVAGNLPLHLAALAAEVIAVFRTGYTGRLYGGRAAGSRQEEDRQVLQKMTVEMVAGSGGPHSEQGVWRRNPVTGRLAHFTAWLGLGYAPRGGHVPQIVCSRCGEEQGRTGRWEEEPLPFCIYCDLPPGWIVTGDGYAEPL